MRFLFLLLIPETGEGRKKEKEENMDVRNIDQLPLAHTSTGDWTCNPGMCPAWPMIKPGDLPVYKMTPNQLRHTSQSTKWVLNNETHKTFFCVNYAQNTEPGRVMDKNLGLKAFSTFIEKQ